MSNNDRNKYNRSSSNEKTHAAGNDYGDDYDDYNFGNFDDDSRFPRGNSDNGRKRIKNYDEYANFGNDDFSDDIKLNYDENSTRDFQNEFPEPDFEEDAEIPIVQAPVQNDDELPPPPPDYGDNFDSQTGERQTKDYKYDLRSDERGEYYTHSTVNPKKRKPVKRKNHRSRNAAIVMTILAVLCLAAAIAFAFTQCGSSGSSSTASTTTAVKSTAVSTQATTAYDGDDTKAPETQAVQTEAPKTEAPKTEAPKTEAPKTEAPTEAPTTQAVQTEAPQTEAPQSSEQQSEILQDAPDSQDSQAYDDVPADEDE